MGPLKNDFSGGHVHLEFGGGLGVCEHSQRGPVFDPDTAFCIDTVGTGFGGAVGTSTVSRTSH